MAETIILVKAMLKRGSREMQPEPFSVCASSLASAVHMIPLTEAFWKGREGWVSRVPEMPGRLDTVPGT